VGEYVLHVSKSCQHLLVLIGWTWLVCSSPGRLLAFFVAETCLHCKDFVVKDGLNKHYVNSAFWFRNELTLVGLDPNHCYRNFCGHSTWFTWRFPISCDNDAKDTMRVHTFDSKWREFSWPGPEVYGNHNRVGLGHFGIIQCMDRLDLVVDSCNSDNEPLSVIIYFSNHDQGFLIHETVTMITQVFDSR